VRAEVRYIRIKKRLGTFLYGRKTQGKNCLHPEAAGKDAEHLQKGRNPKEERTVRV